MVERSTTDPFSPGEVLTRRAAQQPDAIAVTTVSTTAPRHEVTYAELERRANAAAGRLADLGVGPGAMVAIGLPTGGAHVVAAQAAWKLGACAVPMNHRLPAAERQAMLELAHPAAIVADWDGPRDLGPEDLVDDSTVGARPPARQPAPAPFKAIASGGSTGRPKLIVSPGRFSHPDGVHPLGQLISLTEPEICYSPGPLYHNQAFLLSAIVLYHGGHVVLNDRFDASLALRTIEELEVTYLNVVPTMMSRMDRADTARTADLASVRTLLHMAAPCAAWLKRAWIDRLGADRVLELWAATELVGVTVIRGDEWLAHPGSVGRPVSTEILILDEDGEPVPPGVVGEIFSRMPDAEGPSYAYLGADPLPQHGAGFTSVGDMGHLDEDGYLHLADRRTDLIITGGSNVFPAEVEAAISSHPGVADVVVIGLPDDDLGQRVHAIVEPVAGAAPPGVEDLRAHVEGLLTRYKVPRGFDLVATLPRAENGKLRRQALVDQLTGGSR